MSAKKLSATVIVLCLAIFVALSTMVVVLVTSGQTASSIVNISYESEDVSVKLSATAYMDGVSSVFRVGGVGTGANILELNPDNPSGTMSQVDDLAFSDEQSKVVFEYKFENATDYINAYIDLNIDDLTLQNVSLAYAYSEQTPATDVMSIATKTTYDRQILRCDNDRNTIYIYIVAMVGDLTEDADITGNFNFSLGRIADEDLAEIHINQVDTSLGELMGETSAQTYFLGQKIYEPQWQNVTNKRFNGWYLDEALTTPATFPMTLTADTHLYPAYQDANLTEQSFYKYDESTDSYTIGEYILSSYSSLISSYTTLIIPDVFDGSHGVKPVTDIYGYYDENSVYDSDNDGTIDGSYVSKGLLYGTSITHLYIGNNVTYCYLIDRYYEIGYTFNNPNSSLQYVEFGRNITQIVDCFAGNTILTTLRLPGNSIRISSYTNEYSSYFDNASGLESTPVYANNTIITAYNNTEWDFLLKVAEGITNTNQIPNWDSIECCVGYLFVDYYYDTATYTETWTSTLTTATIPTSMTTITPYMFYRCTNLSSVTIPTTVTSIGDYAFQQSAITTLNIPSSVVSIGNSAFCYCTGLTSIIVPDSVVSVGNACFRECSNLTNVALSKNLTSIPDYCFYQCSKLQSVNITNGLTSIGNQAFYGCSSLTSVAIPSTVTSIGTYAFYICSKLTNVELPDGITSIPNNCFSGCTMLRSVNIPSSVTSIGYNAFQNCSSFSTTIGSNIQSIGSFAFENTALRSVTIPATCTSVGDRVFRGCTKLNTIVVESGNPKYDSRNNCNAIIETATNKLIMGCNNSTIPDSVVIIAGASFYGMTGLDTITIPESITKIETYAFYNCTGLTTINYNATNCDNLTTNSNYVFQKAGYSSGGVTLNIGAQVTKIPNYLFSPYASASTSYSMNLVAVNWLGDSCTTIGSYAFAYNTSLQSITIPASVEYIYAYAFSNSNLNKISFEDASIWYKVSSSSNMLSKINGAKTTVTDSSTNATWFINLSGYYNYYWYKSLGHNLTYDANGGTFEGTSVASSLDFSAKPGSLSSDVFTITNVSGTKNYGFSLNSNGYYVSGNKGVNSSYSLAKVSFTAKAGSSVVVTLINSGESNYDFGIFSNLNTTLSASNSADTSNVYKSYKGESSTSTKTLTYNITTDGDYYFYVKYRKDSSSHSGNDSLQFKLLYNTVDYDYTKGSESLFGILCNPNLLPTPTRDGYTFLGWATTPNGNTYVDDEYPILSDTTLYAIWRQN